MGNYSRFATIRNNARIRWELADPSLLRGNDTLFACWENRNTPDGLWINPIMGGPKHRFPSTLAELAEELSGTKLCAYLDEPMIVALNELSRILESTDSVYPRVYFELADYEEVWFFEFHPGETRINIGTLRIGEIMRLVYPLSPDKVSTANSWCRRRRATPTEREWDAYEAARDAAHDELMNRVPEMPGWRVKPLRHVPM